MLDLTDQSGPKPARDLADAGGMGLYALEQLISDIQYQPEWRTRANECAAYYDGKQLSVTKREEMESTGQPVTIINLIQRTINGALGQEARNRVDAMVTCDDPVMSEVAEVVNGRLKESVRETVLDVAVSDAYKSQLVAGVGWVEVSRDPDPLNYQYRVQEVHRNEIWWDWRAKRRDLKDARWLCRQRWADVDEAMVMFPKHKDTLRYCLTDGPMPDVLRLSGQQIERLEGYQSIKQRFRVSEEEWLDSVRKRVRMYEVWYKVPKTVAVLVGRDGQKIVFNARNPIHQQALERGLARMVKGPSYEIRMAMFAGPYRLLDVPTQRRLYPYIPFWCYRDDQHRTPYGLGDGMICSQDEYNQRRSKLLWLLKAKQVFVDNDALDKDHNNFVDLALEAMRPDAMFVLNPARRNPNGLVIKNDTSLSAEQVGVMNDAKQLIQEIPGIYSAMLGDAPSGVTSGFAINSLVEQSMVSLGETNDNYRHGRRMAHEALVELIVEDLRQPNMQVAIGKAKRRRVVVLNAFDQQTGEPINQVAAATLKTGLADVPATPAFQMQQQQQIGQVLTSVGASSPAAVAALVPAFIEASTIPHKEEIAAWLRRQSGVPEPGREDEAEEAAGAQQAQSAQLAQAAQQLQLADAQAKVAETQAKTEKVATDAELNRARVAEIVNRLINPPQQPAPSPEEQMQGQINDALAEAGT